MAPDFFQNPEMLQKKRCGLQVIEKIQVGVSFFLKPET